MGSNFILTKRNVFFATKINDFWIKDKIVKIANLI